MKICLPIVLSIDIHLRIPVFVTSSSSTQCIYLLGVREPISLSSRMSLIPSTEFFAFRTRLEVHHTTARHFFRGAVLITVI
jgi:hypothetical protein